jgi:hypothetical protein
MKHDQYQRQAYALRRLSVACNRAIACERAESADGDNAQRWVSAWANLAGIEMDNLPLDALPSPKDMDELLAKIESSREVTGLSPDGRWLARQDLQWLSEIMPAQTYPAELTTEQCTELAQRDSIGIREWIELTGIGIGLHDCYLITEKGVEFNKWTPQEIAGAPPDWQFEMFGDNETAHLTFPCSPASLAGFVESAIGPHRVSLPNAFTDSLTSGATLPPANEDNRDSSLCVFRAMPSLNPAELKIEIAAGYSGDIVLNISARGTSRRASLDELKLFNKTKAEPNTQYGVLLGLASKRSVPKSEMKIISNLRGILKDRLGITANPFMRTDKGYEAIFCVEDKRDTADRRAKERAERTMLSIDELSDQGRQFAAHQNAFDSEDDEAGKWLAENDR